MEQGHRSYAAANELAELLTEKKSDLGQKLFPELFEKHFGVDLETWQRDYYMPYLIENYRN